MTEASGSSSDAQIEQFKACIVCGEPIRDAAQICTHCNCYQDRTRHIVRWSALLVSLLALLPLGSLSISAWQLAFPSRSAEVKAAILSATPNEVRVAFENVGEVSGIVTRVDFFSVIAGKAAKNEDLEVRGCQADVAKCQPQREVLVSPGDAPMVVSYRAFIGNTEAQFLPGSHAGQDCRYRLVFGWVDFSDPKPPFSREVACP